MDIQLTEAQKMFVHLLKNFGCSKLQTTVMCLNLELPEDMLEMAEYMEQHMDATPTQLYEVCLKISSRRTLKEEQEMNE